MGTRLFSFLLFLLPKMILRVGIITSFKKPLIVYVPLAASTLELPLPLNSFIDIFGV